MSVPVPSATDHPEDDASLIDPAFARWRRIHRGASFALAAVALVQLVLTVFRYVHWASEAAWFLGAGLGLLLLATMNLAHIGLGPCRMPTAVAVRGVNWAFVMYGVGVATTVSQLHAGVLVLVLLAQAISSQRTLLVSSQGHG